LLIFAQVNVLDAVPFITKIAGVAGTEAPKGSAYSRYYILHGARHNWKEFGAALAKVLYAKGAVSSPEPKQVTIEEAGEGEAKYLVAGNMLVKGDRAAAMGFKPTHPSMVESMASDLASLAM
jgi:hypothetical protein